MRSKFVLKLWAAVAFLLVQVPQATMGNPALAFDLTVMVLEPLISGMIADMRSQSLQEEVTAKIWMHTDDPKANGCGFYFQVDGHSGHSENDWFPRNAFHNCHDKTYYFRMTSQSAAYEKKLHLGNDQAKRIEVHADGAADTRVKSLCLGLSANTIVGGPRAFCINNNVLKACKAANANWTSIDLDHEHIMFTRSTRGIHKIIFKNIEQLVGGYENAGGGDMTESICSNIELVAGDQLVSWVTCPAKLHTTSSRGSGAFWSSSSKDVKTDVNPYGCPRYTGLRW